MPFVNGKYYMNPFYGRALERDRLRAAGSENTEPEVIPASEVQEDENGHWITIDHRHVLIHERQGNRPRIALSAKGLDFIEHHEGFWSRVYTDPAGKKTVGYGHVVRSGEKLDGGVSEQQATALLQQDVKDAVNAVNGELRVPVTQNQFDALVDLAFNEGPVSVLAENEIMRAVNSGHVSGANFSAYRYVKIRGKYAVSKGLFDRRNDEWLLYSKGKY